MVLLPKSHVQSKLFFDAVAVKIEIFVIMVGESSNTLYIEDCRQRVEIGRFRNVLKLFVDEEALSSQAFSAFAFFETWTGMVGQCFSTNEELSVVFTFFESWTGMVGQCSRRNEELSVTFTFFESWTGMVGQCFRRNEELSVTFTFFESWTVASSKALHWCGSTALPDLSSHCPRRQRFNTVLGTYLNTLEAAFYEEGTWTLVHGMTNDSIFTVTVSKSNFDYAQLLGPQWPSSKVKASRPDCSRFETQSHRISGVYAGLLQAKSYVRGQMSSRQCDAEVWGKVRQLRRHPTSSSCGRG
ncbi:hypothetical protein AVEN_180791-1 [Araneus ventricosus]|uniref:Uncharacterized protein n=1 Tax=Araneus ventricosus TaxID=182803 RepID=A0A4Y2FFA7_ARAVE|nr:hypothetical protein AVEN_180791-1 [Araneus ventricosus]